MKNYIRRQLLVCLFSTVVFAANAQFAPKREMRGVWIATVMNIDFPIQPTTDDARLRDEFVRLIDQHKALGINALFVQIRPMADAFYPSNLVPYSRFLTGQSGVAPANGFDMLAFMIQATHERGMEFHAWLNPYRVSMDNPTPSVFAENHILRAHPDWCVFYNKRYIMNPGLPQVRNHLNDVVAELVTRYNLDGIHFDDYFYPYKNGNEQFNDYSTYEQFRGGFANIEDWRRNNVDLLIQQLSLTIKKIRPRVQFGISPFGVWRNIAKDAEGSDTRAGMTNYDDLYADVRKWLREGWIDYVVPQIYWTIGFSIADHDKIVRWWSANSAGKPVYVGHGAYRIGQGSAREPAWSDPAELPRQIRLSRSLPNVRGSVYFSSKSLINNPLGFSDSLRQNFYRYPALPPEAVKDTSLLACEPPEIRPITTENGRVVIRWQQSRRTQRRQPFQYVVYRFPYGKVDFTNSQNIISIMPSEAKELVVYDRFSEGEALLYAVTAVDCQNRETPPDDVAQIGSSPSRPQQSPPSVQTAPRKHVSWWTMFWRKFLGKG